MELKLIIEECLMKIVICLYDALKNCFNKQQSKGRTPVLIVVDYEFIGVRSVSDTLRKDFTLCINEMRKNDRKKVIMLNGIQPLASA